MPDYDESGAGTAPSMQPATVVCSEDGPLPEHWHGRFKYYEKQGNDGWYDQSRVPDEQKTLVSKVAKSDPMVSQEEQELVVTVFEEMFCYEPTCRLTSAQLLECPELSAVIGRYTSIPQLNNKGRYCI